MLFRKHIVSMCTLLQLSVASVFFIGGAAAAFAAGAGVAPVLVPYTVNALAGNEQPSNPPTNTSLPAAGYGGDGKTGLLTTLNSPNALAVDAAGNIYWADTSNAIIRELNAQTGIVNTIAGVPPANCVGYQNTSCSKTTIGCSEAVPALNNPIGGKIVGIAVDANDNVYFADSAQFTISVVYHGGAQVANFITLVDPAGVAASKGVIQGYVYHIGGSINLTSCVGTKGSLDNVLAFQSAQMSNTAGQIALDGAGNLYIQDVGNSVVRVINTQSTAQQFFQSVVQPGYMRAIVNCSGALTVLCPTVVTPTAGTGITFPANPNSQQQPGSSVADGPANALTLNTLTGMGVDAYGNVYQVNNKNATPGIYGSVSMAGGTPLGHYLSLLWPGVNIAYGDSYEAANDISRSDSLAHYYDNILANATGAVGGTVVVRPTNITADPLGNIWVYDNHWPAIFRYDVNSGILLDVVGFGGGNGSGTTPYDVVPNGRANYNSGAYGSNSAPTWCIEGPAGSTPFGAGPQTFDGRLDGCPAKVSTTSGNGELISDGFGNIFNADTSDNEIREFSEGNFFPATAIGSKVTQAIDVHFDASNPPVVSGVSTAALSFSAGNTDFSIDTTDPEFQALLWVHAAYGTLGPQNFNGGSGTVSTIQMYSGAPSCIQNAAASGDASWDCLVYVTFSPTAGGLRETQLVATTANGGVYNFPLVGTGNAGQLSIDGGQQSQVPATGLGATSSVAVDTTGKIYIADPANNRIVVCVQGSGSLCKTQTTLAPVFPATVTTTTLSSPMGVAVDSDNNIYIADTGNNRILEVNPQTSAATVLGGIAWVSCQPTQAANLTSPPAKPCPVVPSGSAPPSNPNLAGNAAVTPGPIPVYNPLQQYLFKAPQGLAVDLNGNVYVADTGNAAIVEIPKNPVLGGATPLFQYSGAPTFVTPVAVAVDPSGNIYVADTGNPFQQVVKIAPGGGDFQNLLPLNSHLPLIGGQSISTPNGVAVDSGGNVFISDSGANTVWEAPAAGPPNGPPFTLSFTGLSSPAGLAIDTSGGLYVADSGNKQILYVNRQNPVGNFGTVPQGLDVTTGLGMITGLAGTPVGCLQNGSSTPCAGYLTVTNSGNQPIVLQEPIATLTGGNPAFGFTNTCTTTPLLPGSTCTISPTFQPTSNGQQTATLTVNGTQSVALVANGAQPEAKIVLTGAYSGGTPTTGGTATLTATVSQPHVPPGGTPTGTVTFAITIDSGIYASGACGANTTVTVPLVGGVASTAINPLLQGRIYSIVATYNGDTNDSPVASTPLSVTVPPIPITATAASLSFTYGVKPSAITGTITGVDSSVTASFTSAASQYSPVSGSPYPVTIAVSGGDFCNYGNPPVYNPGTTTQAVVTEMPTTLKDTLATFTSLYGAPDINFALGLTYIGAVNGDQNKLTPSFYLTNPAVPVKSSLLAVSGSPYTINPIFSGKPISPFNDYTVTYSPGTLIITQAPSQIGTVTTTAFSANTVNGSKTITAVTSPQGLVIGAAVSGTGIASGATVTAISGNSITLSAAATASTPVPPAAAAPVTVTYTFKNSMLSGALVTGTFSAQVSTAVPGGIGTATGTVTVYDTTTPITAVAPGLGTVILPCSLPFVAATTSGSPTVTVTSAYDLAAGEAVTGPGIPSGTTITSAGVTSITLSANATATAGFVILTSATNTTPCNAPIPLPSLVNGLATFTPANTALGLHQYAFYYTGDSNFLPSVLVPATISASAPACAPAAITANCELVDVGDFAMTSTTGVLPIVPGVTPSGNGLLAAPGQNSTYPESASINVVSLLSQTGVVSLTCLPIGNPNASTLTANTTSGSPTLSSVSSTSGLTPGYPITGAGIPSGATIVSIGATTITISANATATATGVTVSFIVPPPANAGTAQSYIQCAMTPPAVTLTAGGTSTTVLSVFTPVTEPLGYQYFSSVRMPGSGTVLAFLPLGVLVFCMRRRRRLSKVLWMLLAIAAVTAGMSGCGGNLVDFYAPIPQGPQYVQITATANSITSPGTTETRTYLVQIYID